MKKIINYCDKIDSTFSLEQDINCNTIFLRKKFFFLIEDIEI